MMKRIAALFITGLMLITDLLSQSTPQNMTMDSPPAPGVYEATESITLQPGFSFTATQGNSLTLRIASEEQFAQGIVTGYADGQKWINNPLTPQYTLTTFPSDAQLDRLTHVIASGGIGCHDDGRLFPGTLPNSWNGNSPGWYWNGQKNLWLESLVSRAHQKGVKVSIMLGGDYFSDATSTSVLGTFVGNVVNFVNLHGLDGVDIDWEYPQNLADWTQCINLLNALKNSLPQKRISIALAGYPNNSMYPALSVPQTIWDIADAIHLMTYDNGDWQTYSRADNSKNVIDSWAGLATPSNNLDIKKLFLACAFYGYNTNNSSLWNNNAKVSYATYSAAGFSGNPGDSPTDVTAKVNHCLNEGYGGVFIWELGYDVSATSTSPPSLLNTVWAATHPTIAGPDQVCYSGNTFTLYNAPAGTVTWTVNGPFSFSPSSYITSATGNPVTVYRIAGTGSNSGTLTAKVNGTAVATQPVTPCPPAAISGPSTICHSGSIFTLSNPPGGVIYWTVSNTGLFSVNPSGGSTVVTRNTGYGTATLSARIGSTGGTVVATKVIESVNLTSFPNFGEQPVQYLSCGESGSLAPPYTAGVVSYAWTYYFAAGNFSFSGSDDQWEGLSASATFYENGYYVFDGYAIDACHIQSPNASIRYVFEVSGCNSSPFGFAYPNPVSGILTVDVDAAAAARSKPAVQSITGAQSLKPAAAYDLRLYDGQGNLLRQRKASGGTVEFNVANLPGGIYYLHIYDGTGEKPTMQQIVIEH